MSPTGQKPGSASGGARFRKLLGKLIGGRRGLVAGALVLVGVAWLLRPLFSWTSEPTSLETTLAGVPAPPARESVYDTLGSGETLAELMGDNGFGPHLSGQ